MSGGSPQPGVLLVASQMGQKLDFFDVPSLERLATIDDLIAQPHEMAYDPGRRLAYLTHTYREGAYGEGKPKGHELSVIDVDRRKVVDTIDIGPWSGPHDVEFDPVADLIYTGVERDGDGRNGLLAIDAETHEVAWDVPLRADNAHWIALSPDGSRCFASHKEGEHISVVDLRERVELDPIPSPGGTEEIDTSPDGRFLFAAAPVMSIEIDVSHGRLVRKAAPPGTPAPRLMKIDTASGEVVGELEFEELVSAMRVGPGGVVLVSEMHFPDPDAPGDAVVPGRVHAVDGETMERLGSAVTEELPFTVRFAPDGATAFVANLKSGTVSVLDVATCEIDRTLDNNPGVAFGGTHGMCFAPAGPGADDDPRRTA
jgi:DNA-binding beta-propeller fold protein YncE